MSLALVLPTRDDGRDLDRLLDRAAVLGCFAEIVVFDDGSDPAVPPVAPGPEPVFGARPRTTLLRTERAGGAGRARNLALEHVTAEHVLFFDADDMLTNELPRLWRSLVKRDFDLCLFRHSDSRHTGQMPADEALWHQAGALPGALREMSPESLPVLAQTANYPWNRLYRTAFLRENAIRFSELPVHNDIAAHWQALCAARQVLTSDRICALHRVEEGSGRLTDRRGVERLAVFDALAEAARSAGLPAEGDGPFALPFLRFASLLLDWVRERVPESLLPAFDLRMAAALRDWVPPARFARLQRRDPVLALRITLQMATERAA